MERMARLEGRSLVCVLNIVPKRRLLDRSGQHLSISGAYKSDVTEDRANQETSVIQNWACSHCKAHNHPRRHVCWQCGWTRTEKAAQEPNAIGTMSSVIASSCKDTPQMNQDQEHLKLLSIFHYVVGGIAALFAFFPICHLSFGIAMVADALSGRSGSSGALLGFGLMFVVIPALFILIGLAYAISVLLTGRFIAHRKRHTFCFVVACINTLFTPFGTVLGVFTIIVLLRPSVKALFGVDTVPRPPSVTV